MLNFFSQINAGKSIEWSITPATRHLLPTMERLILFWIRDNAVPFFCTGSINRAVRVAELQPGAILQQFHTGFPETTDSADVHPVTLKGIGKNAAPVS